MNQEKQPEILFSSTHEDQLLRRERQVFRGITDYMTDDFSLDFNARTEYYKFLK
jgi:hypothetical protein